MRNVLLPVYDRNNIPLDSFRDAAFLYEGQRLTLHEASILCFCIGASFASRSRNSVYIPVSGF